MGAGGGGYAQEPPLYPRLIIILDVAVRKIFIHVEGVVETYPRNYLIT